MAPLVVIVGETGSGKSALGLRLAKLFDGEIICADSRTVYRGMDVGTAKPTKAERRAVKHHLLNVVDPDEPFTVADFKELAEDAIEQIDERGKLPIMVGGTGLYVDAVLFDYGFALPEAIKDPLNPRHLSSEVATRKTDLRPNTLMLGLTVKREELEQKLIKRLDMMLEAGLEKEVRKLAETFGWACKALSGVGYQEWQAYFSGQQLLDKTKAAIIRDSLQYAKRQRTWFKRNKSIHWLNNREDAVELVTTFLNNLQ